MEEIVKEVEEKVYENKHLREKGGFQARKKRGEDIKEEVENERVFQALKREQRERSEGLEGFGLIFEHLFG